MRAAYIDCPSGASGNMLLGAFIDAGAPLESITRAVSALGLSGAAGINVEEAERAGRHARYVTVDVLQPQPWRSVSEIDHLIERAELDQGIRERSRLAFRLLAQAEAKAHGVALEQVRLHEAGAVDAVVDVVGTFAAADALGVEAFYASPLPLSSKGSVEGEHGTIALPAPAAVNILESVGAPTYTKETEAELVTPTGAAIIGACAVFQEPRLINQREGFGAGTAELEWPNVVRVVLGDVEEPPEDIFPVDQQLVTVIETNIDDMAPNLLAELPQDLLDAGALEAFITPVVMKKGRAAHLVTAVVPPDLALTIAGRLLRETTTLGVRLRDERRLVAERRIEVFGSSLGDVRVKLKLLEGKIVGASPEFDDVRRLAEGRRLPLQDAHQTIAAEARAAYVTSPEGAE